MDIVVTIRVAPAGGSTTRGPVDVHIRARKPLTAADLVERLNAALPATGTSVEVAGRPVAPDHRVGLPPLLHGCEIRLVCRGAGSPDRPTDRSPRGRTRREDAASPTDGRIALADLTVTAGPDCGHRVPVVVGGVRLGRHPGGSTTPAVGTGAVMSRSQAETRSPLLPTGRPTGPGAPAYLLLGDPGISREHCAVTATPSALLLSDGGSTNGTAVNDDPITTEPRSITADDDIVIGSTHLALRSPTPPRGHTEPTGEGHLDLLGTAWRPAQPPAPLSLTEPTRPVDPAKPSPPWLSLAVPVPIAVVLAWFFGPQYLLFACLGPLTMGASWVTERRRWTRQRSAQMHDHRRAREAHGRTLDRAIAAERRALTHDHPDAVTLLDAATQHTGCLWGRRRIDPTFGRLRLGLGDVRAGAVTVARPGSAEPRHHHEPVVLKNTPVTLGVTPGIVVRATPSRSEQILRHLVGQLAILHSPADLTLVPVLDGPRAGEWAWLGWLPHSIVSPSRADPQDVDRTLAALASAPRNSPPRGGSATDPAVVLVIPDLEASLRGRPGLDRLLAERDPAAFGLVAATASVSPVPQTPILTLAPDLTGTLHLTDGTTVRLVPDGVGLWWSLRLARSVAPLWPKGVARRARRGASLDLWQVNALARPTGAQAAPAEEHASDLVASISSRWRRSPGEPGHSGEPGEAGEPGRAPRPIASVGEADDGSRWRVDLVGDGPHLLIGGTTGSGKSELLRSLILGLAIDAPPTELTFLLVDYKGGAAFGRCADLPHAVGLVTDLDPVLARRTLTSLRAEIHRRERLLAAHGVDDFEGYWALPPGDMQESLPRLVIVIDEFRVLAQELPDFLSGVVHCAAVGRSLGIHLVLATQRPAGVISPDIAANVNLRIALRMRDRADSEQVIGSPEAAHVPTDRPGTGFARHASGDLTRFRSVQASAPLRPPDPPVSVRRVDAPTPMTADPPRGRPTDEAALVGLLAAAAASLHLPRARPPVLPPLPTMLADDFGDEFGDEPRDPQGTMRDEPPTLSWAWGLLDDPSTQRQKALLWSPTDRAWRIVGGSRSGRSTALTSLVTRLTAPPGPAPIHVYAVGGPSLAPLADLPHVACVIPGDDLGRLRRLAHRLDRDLRHSGRGVQDAAAVVLVIDDWDAHARLGAPSQELLERMVTAVLDAGGSGCSVLVAGGPVAAASRVLRTARTVALGGLDAATLSGLGLRSDVSSADSPPGRGVLVSTGYAVQLSTPRWRLTDSDPWPHPRPDPVLDLPHCVTLPRPSVVGADSAARPEVALGLGHDGVIHWTTATWGPHLLVAGPSASGRSTALATLAGGLVESGRHTVTVSVTPERFFDTGAICLGVRDEGALQEILIAQPDCAVLLDDADSMGGTQIEGLLPALVEHVEAHGGRLAVSVRQHTLATAFRGVVPALAQRQTALLLGPTSRHDGDALGVRIDPPATRVPGRGILVVRGRAEEIQVAKPAPRWSGDRVAAGFA